MKSRKLVAAAVAGAFAWSGTALAGSAFDVHTPISVSESAPWLANERASIHGSDEFALSGYEPGFGLAETASLDASHPGSASSFDTTASASFDHGFWSHGASGIDYSLGSDQHISGFEPQSMSGSTFAYWSDQGLSDTAWFSESEGHDAVGSTMSWGGSGFGGFDSTAGASHDDSFALSEHYIVSAPLSEFDGTNYRESIEIGFDLEGMEELMNVGDAYVLTPNYEYMPEIGFEFDDDQLGLQMDYDFESQS